VARPYIKREVRKKQIVEAALRLVAERGVGGATLNRVAAGVGLTTPALYAHFQSRKELLMEAMDTVFEKVRELHRSARHPNALERLREIGLAHTKFVSTEQAFPLLFFEFIMAPPHEDLREVLGSKELMLVEDLAEIAREGQRQGTIRAEVDPYQIAWMLVSRAWTEDVTRLMGLAEHWNEERSKWMLDHILEAIAAPDPSGEFGSPRLPRPGRRGPAPQ